MEAGNDESELDKQLSKIYYSSENPGSYGGIQRLMRAAKEKGINGITQEKIEKYLSNQQSYSLHKPARKNFQRNKTVVQGIDQQWQADLADMQALSRDNGGIHYLLTVIDVFSKFAWAIPVKKKSAEEMVKGFEILFKKAHPRIPQRLQTDAGKEFLNKPVQTLLKSKGIHHFASNSDKKAAVVERFNRTLKSRIWTYFTARQTRKYMDILDSMVDSYNKSFHRSIGMSPVQVKKSDEDKIWNRLYGQQQFIPSKKKKLEKGQKVRISNVKGSFDKGYVPNWSEEHFLVQERKEKGKPVYKLTDKSNEDLKGAWYREEVQPIEKNKYLVEKVIRKRVSPTGQREVLVKWKGWPTKFNTWIEETELTPIDTN